MENLNISNTNVKNNCDSENLKTIYLSDSERNSVRKAIDLIRSNPENLNENIFLDRVDMFTQYIPERVRHEIDQFKRFETSHAIIIKNNPFDDTDIGPTPEEYIELKEGYQLNAGHMVHGLYSCLLGSVFSFLSQRKGHCFTNIIPLKEYENVSNISSGSKYEFGFHNEDAFHPAMGDYIGLVCMRNLEKAVTYLSSVRDVELTDEEKELLFQPVFEIEYNAIHDVNEEIELPKLPILFGKKDAPYMRLNAANINVEKYPEDVQQALRKLMQGLDDNRFGVTLETGDCLYIDNFHTAHARNVYKPFYGADARWLSRAIITKDLRKSIDYRGSNTSRMIVS